MLDGNFSKVSHNAFNGYTNLEEVVITDRVCQIDHSAFKDCSSLHTIYIGTEPRREGMADFHNIPVISRDVLAGTAVKSIYMSAEVSEIQKSGLPSGLSIIYGTRGTLAETFAATNGYNFADFSSNLDINIYIGDHLFANYKYLKGDILDKYFFEHNGKIYAVYLDKGCTVPYDVTKPVEKSLTLYAKPVLSFDGWSVRTRDYKGLRSVFEYDTSKPGKGIEIVEVGAIVFNREYALDDFRLSSECNKVSVYKDGEKIGLTLGPKKNNKEAFAVTIVGFEKADYAERALKNFVFRGFITVRNNITDLETTFYTDAVGTTLRAASQQYLKYVSGSKDERSFVGEIMAISEPYCDEVRYDKDTLMSIFTDIYNDNGKLLVGEEIRQNST